MYVLYILVQSRVEVSEGAVYVSVSVLCCAVGLGGGNGGNGGNGGDAWEGGWRDPIDMIPESDRSP